MKPHSISHIAVCLTPEVGANDTLVGVRVVPMGHQGKTILGRTLMDGEQDSGEPIRFYPYDGESIHFAPGSVQMRALCTEVLTRMGHLEYDGKPAYLRSNFQRGVKRLPVRWWRRGGSR